MSCFIPNWVIPELNLSNICSKTQANSALCVEKIQEWLNLHGHHTSIDGKFGVITETLVKVFQKKHHLTPDGVVGPITFENLISPLRRAINIPLKRTLDISFTETNTKIPINKYIVNIARQHLKQNVREVGGANRGPWVRTYMRGNEGREWSWCCGLVGFVLAQAKAAMGEPIDNLNYTFSCDVLAERAKANYRFVDGKELSERQDLKPGDIFLNRRTSTDWTHTGFVTKIHKDFFVTIEGNSSEGLGSREGTGIFSCVRSYKNRDFIRI